MAIKKHYLSHYAGEEVRWYYKQDGELKLSNDTGVLKGWDDKTLEWIVKTKDGQVRANLVCNEAERVKYFEDISKAYCSGFHDGMEAAGENGQL